MLLEGLKAFENQYGYKKLDNYSNSVGDVFGSTEGLPTEEELVFEEMDLIVREEINRLEQGLTEYLKSQLGGRLNSEFLFIFIRIV